MPKLVDDPPIDELVVEDTTSSGVEEACELVCVG